MEEVSRYEIRLPSYCLSYVFNNDSSGIEEEDKHNTDQYLEQFYTEAVKAGGHVIIDVIYDDPDNNYFEPHFTWNIPFGLACDVVDCIVLIVK